MELIQEFKDNQLVINNEYFLFKKIIISLIKVFLNYVILFIYNIFIKNL
jgi:hypothetical protein